MAEAEPSNLRRLAIGIGLILAAAIALVLVVQNRPEKAEPGAPAATTNPGPGGAGTETTAPQPSTVVTPPVLGRSELLQASRAAAAAYSDATDAPQEVAALAGRRFQLRIPFGCAGPASDPSATSASWSINPENGSLRISVRPEVWTESAFAQTLGVEGVEAVEGFWIPRPWQNGDRCPARTADPLQAEPPTPSPQTVGLATVFGPNSSRLNRRGERPYELTLPVSDAARPTQGLQLVLEGRLTALPDGRLIACRSASPDQRPVCLIGAQIDRVAVRDPASQRSLGEWRDAGPPAAPNLQVPSGATGAPAAQP